jgi:thiamine-phosphate pyrophosphorylase
MIKYQITDPSYYPLENIFSKDVGDFISLRDKTSNNIYEIASKFLYYTKKINKISVINRHYEIGIELGFDMIHLNSDQFHLIDRLDVDRLVVSCHSLEDLLYCQTMGVKCATISPIFEVENKGTPIGVNKLKEFIQSISDINLIALGGIISDNQIRELDNIGLYGFASIRYFVKEN